MTFLSALVYGYLVLWGEIGSAETHDQSLHRSAFKPVGTLIEKAADPEPLEEATEGAGDLSDEPLRKVKPGSIVFNLPDGCRSVEGGYDVVLHFHGAPPSIEPAFERSGLEGVLVLVNLGIGSGRYERAFEIPHAFDRFLDRTNAVVASMCPEVEEHPIKRIALSGWSAGYGAIWRILEREMDDERIDAVLLADGLHAGFKDPERRRGINQLQLTPFEAFADQAAAGERLMAISHSAIPTETYASTTETSDFLIEKMGLSREWTDSQGPRPGMVLKSQLHFGAFHVQGYAGINKAAHADHLHAIGDTLFPLLRQRWLH